MYSTPSLFAIVLYDVYTLFLLGHKRSLPEVRAIAPSTGELRLRHATAELTTGPERVAVITQLGRCAVKAINAEGTLLITGSERILAKPVYKKQFDDYPQGWLCKPVDPTVRRR